jgi:hypothetical protein
MSRNPILPVSISFNIVKNINEISDFTCKYL